MTEFAIKFVETVLWCLLDLFAFYAITDGLGKSIQIIMNTYFAHKLALKMADTKKEKVNGKE